MNKAFVTLYALIVVSVVVIGWGLNKIWEAQTPDNPIGGHETEIIQLIELQLSQLDDPETSDLLKKINTITSYSVELIPTTDMTQTSILQRLQAGEIIHSSDDSGRIVVYKELNNRPFVLSLSLHAAQTASPFLQTLMMLTFYAAIAVAIFFWVWPQAILMPEQKFSRPRRPSNWQKLTTAWRTASKSWCAHTGK
jgi:two-component system OmpR family sensor kinase